MVALIVFVGVLQTSRATIEFVQDRPLTWDWQGTIPLTIEGPLSQAVEGWIGEMRSGEYYRVYFKARDDLEAHPDHLVDTWIMAECARSRKDLGDIDRDSLAALARRRSPASLLLRLRALGLMVATAHHDIKIGAGSGEASQMLVGQSVAAMAPILKELQPEARSQLAILVAETSYGGGDFAATRLAAKAFAEKHPTNLPVQLIVVRALIRGFYYYTIGDGGKLGPGRPGPPEQAPRYGEALAQLDALEKRFGNDPLIDYYRSVAYAMKAEIGDPTKEDVGAAKRKASAFAAAFIKEGSDYPRLVSTARDYLSHGRIGWYFPVHDE